MSSLLSDTFGIFRTSILKPQTWRLFSSSLVNYAPSMDPELGKKRDESNRRRRLRYASDPQYREKLIVDQRAWHARRSQDPAYAEARNQHQNSRYFSDYEFRKARRDSFAKSHVRLQAEDARYRLKKNLYEWCMRLDWVREMLPWKTHEPVLFAEKVHKECKGCTRFHVREGLRLWWRKISGVESWLCHACYIPMDDHTAAMPHGYEDVTTLKELVTRKKELARQAKA